MSDGPIATCSIVLFVLFLSLNGCKSASGPVNNDNAPSNTIVSSTPPFQTKEPERYQAIRTITTTTADGKTVVTKTTIARDGDRRRQESETLSKRIAYLDLPEGKFVLLMDDKVYADLAGDLGSPASEDEEITPERLLHDDTGATSYQNLGKEVVGGRNANKYKTVVNSSSAGNVSPSETLIWIDEALNMPIRSETTSPDGTQITIELSNLTLEVDASLFQIPNDYEKTAFSEFRKRLTATE
jgi:outer membrane lipoprotein-sorting protein